MSNLIACPNCHTEIEISAALESQLTNQIRNQLESELRGKRAEFNVAQSQLLAQQQALVAERDTLAQQIQKGIDAERTKIVAAAQKQAAESLTLEMQDQATQLAELRGKLETAQSNELTLRQRERELQSKADELKLATAREVDSQRQKIREDAYKQFADEHQLKDAETEKRISDMRRQIDDLKRKAEQGSVQTQGEVQELALESMLQASFPADTIQPVGKGANGADCRQLVYCSSGNNCGSILWESKRTKNFGKDWLAKLRDDQRSARASLAVIVTQTMPDGVDTFALIDGVWVCSWRCANGLAMALRANLIEVFKSQIAAQGRAEKMELVYNYLSGQEFQRSVSGIVEAFITMREDLESEKRAIKRIWKKREKQIERAVDNTSGLYGDLQGIIGSSLPTVDGLALPLIEGSANYGTTTSSE